MRYPEHRNNIAFQLVLVAMMMLFLLLTEPTTPSPYDSAPE
jgi:hypothetical protein